jgi:hypothetical protein
MIYNLEQLEYEKRNRDTSTATTKMAQVRGKNTNTQ